MAIPNDTYCIQCNLRRNLELARSLGTEEQATDFARKLMTAMVELPEGAPSPVLGPKLAQLLQECYGLPLDRFAEEKEQSNRFVLERMDAIRERVDEAEDPVYAGLQFAILGNYLDFSALQGNISFEQLEELLDKALEMEMDRAVYADFCADLEKGGKLLYLTDNAGEIGFDRIFAEKIAQRYPQAEITFCVRGGVAQNDATRADAEAVGVPFPVIDNGNRVAGTVPELMSEESRHALDTADIILAKGMGNCETLYGCGRNIYYAFLIKCQKFEAIFRERMLTPMWVRDPQWKV